MVKRIFKQVGILFHRQGILEGPRDVFYLTVDECVGAVRGMSTTRDLKALVRIRKSEYEEFSRSSPAPRVVTRGLVHSHRVESSSEMPLADSNHEAELMGIGCSPGRVQGIAKVVMDPDGDLAVNGEILVAPMTDPAWVFLMVAAKGLVAERGSILSHTAIIGRELGIPTVVGVPHATSLIRDGRVLVLDGEKGSVQLMAADDGGPPSPKA
jgi:pyruvate,water dikinase